MPRKLSEFKFKKTDVIKRACKQLMEYELYNFWYFEFGIRAFLTNEDPYNYFDQIRFFTKHLDVFVDFPEEIATNKIDNSNPVTYLDSYGKKIRFMFNNYYNSDLLDSIFVNKADSYYTKFIKIFHNLADKAFKYGIYPHQLLFPKGFSERCATAIKGDINTESIIKEIQTGVDDYDFSDNFNKNKIEELIVNKKYEKDFFKYFIETPLIDYSSREGFDYFINNMKKYKNNLSFTTNKNPFHKKYIEEIPVSFEITKKLLQKNSNIKNSYKNCYVEIVENMDTKKIAEKICTNLMLEPVTYICDDILKHSEKENTYTVVFSIDLKYKDIKRIKSYIYSILTIVKHRILYSSPLVISKLYFLLPLVLAEKDEKEIEQIILNKYSKESITNYKSELDLECTFIDCIHKLVNGHNHQFSYARNSLGLFIWDMHHFEKMKLSRIYELLTKEDETTDLLSSFFNKKNSKKNNKKTEKKEILESFEIIRKAWEEKSKQDWIQNNVKTKILDEPKKAYEQVCKLIKEHCKHPLFR